MTAADRAAGQPGKPKEERVRPKAAEPSAADLDEAREGSASARDEGATWFARGIGFVGGGLLAYGIVLGFIGASSVVLLFFIALLLASALEPLVAILRSHLPVGRGASLLLVYAAFFALVLVMALVVIPGALHELGDLSTALPAAIKRGKDATSGLQPEALRSSLSAIFDAATQALKPGPPPAADEVVAEGLAVGNAVAAFTTVFALVYFWMTERARLQRFMLSFIRPERRAGSREAWNDVELRLGNWVRGQLTLMGALAVMTGIAYSVLGLPAALLLALIAGLAEAVPIVGPALGVGPAVLVALAIKPEVLPFVVIAYVVIQLVESNILVPIVMRNAIGVSPLLIILSLLAGAALGGLAGALVAVPAIAGLEAVLERLQDREVAVAEDSAAAQQTPEVEAAAT
jgi:predicted PurR-regulated permease PerM